MDASLFSAIFLAALALSTAVHYWLIQRQSGAVAGHRDRVPDAFAAKIPLASHQKAADYTLAKLRLERMELAWGVVWLLIWTLGGGLQLLDASWQAAGWDPVWTGVGFLISLMLIGGIIDLPWSIYGTFGIEQRFGFNRTTPGTFIADMLKHTALTLALGVPLIWVVMWLMLHAGAGWWLWVWCVMMAFSLFMMWAYPAFIAPLFNKFTPLDDEALRARIEKLLQRCGFASKGIFVIDGSKRSGHGNAYFAGLGSNKRIVFFDTLLQSLGAEEIEAVLAHELGHFRRKHIRKRMIVMSVYTLAGLALLGWLMQAQWFYAGLGLEQVSVHGALALFLLVSPVFTFFMQPLIASMSRKHEFEADDFAAEHSHPGDLIQALVKLYQDNASTLTPDPIYSAFHESHPPAPVRVAHLSGKLAG